MGENNSLPVKKKKNQTPVHLEELNFASNMISSTITQLVKGEMKK